MSAATEDITAVLKKERGPLSNRQIRRRLEFDGRPQLINTIYRVTKRMYERGLVSRTYQYVSNDKRCNYTFQWIER